MASGEKSLRSAKVILFLLGFFLSFIGLLLVHHVVRSMPAEVQKFAMKYTFAGIIGFVVFVDIATAILVASYPLFN